MAIARRNLIMTPWLTAKVIFALNLAQCYRTCDCIFEGIEVDVLTFPPQEGLTYTSGRWTLRRQKYAFQCQLQMYRSVLKVE